MITTFLWLLFLRIICKSTDKLKANKKHCLQNMFNLHTLKTDPEKTECGYWAYQHKHNIRIQSWFQLQHKRNQANPMSAVNYDFYLCLMCRSVKWMDGRGIVRGHAVSGLCTMCLHSSTARKLIKTMTASADICKLCLFDLLFC